MARDDEVAEFHLRGGGLPLFTGKVFLKTDESVEYFIEVGLTSVALAQFVQGQPAGITGLLQAEPGGDEDHVLLGVEDALPQFHLMTRRLGTEQVTRAVNVIPV